MSTSRTQTPFPALIVHCWTKSRKAREPLLCWMMNRRTAKGRWVFAASVLLCRTYKILESWSWLSRWWDYTSTSYLKHSQHSQAEAWWCWHWWWLRQGEYFSLLCPQAAVSTSCSHQAHLSWKNRNWMARRYAASRMKPSLRRWRLVQLFSSELLTTTWRQFCMLQSSRLQWSWLD